MATTALILGIGAAASAGISAAGSAQAGKAGAAAGAAASASYTKAGGAANKLLDEAQGSALDLLDPYRKKLDNIPQVLADSIAGNLQLLPNATGLARKVNNFNQNELNRLLRKALPGVNDMVQQASNNTLSMLRGQLPADVEAQIRRRSAGAALSGGFAGAEGADALTARDLGLTSLNLATEGGNAAQRWIQTARSSLMPALYDPTSQLSTPSLTLQGILAGAGLAKDQAEIITSTAARKAGTLLQAASNATGAQLSGSAAQIAGDKGTMDAISKGIQGITGAAAGSYMPTGSSGPGEGLTLSGTSGGIPASVFGSSGSSTGLFGR